ncbi:MAG TPA: dockerin type I domain-containing protein [Lacipirellulaceae bacterium]|nr:dockerin type I domain-containing protein [Lacipirellulaceae bacterium]
MFYRATLLALAFIVLPVVCYAEVITAYDLTGKAGNEFFDSATASAPHVNGEALLRGDGLAATAATNSFAASGWDDNSPRDYFTFSFFVAPGYQVTLTDLLIATRSSGTGPGSLWLYYNYTGTLDLIRETFTQSGSTTLNSDVDLANLTVTGRATFTIYRDPFFGSASGGAVAPSGTFRIANYTDPDTSVISPITFLGTVSRIGESGDFNGDGMVDAGDYDVWRNAFGSTSQLDADGNVDGVVDAADYVLWRTNLGSSAGRGTSAAVPEPASLTLFAMGGLLALSRRLKSTCNGKREHVPSSI